MNFLEQLKKLLLDAKDDKDTQNYLAEMRKPTPEGVTAYLESEEGKKLIQPRLDKHFTTGLDTWKSKTLPSVLEEEIKKKFPAETEDQKKIRKIEDDLQSEKKARIRETLKNRYISAATSKGLPVDLADHFIGEDENSTDANVVRLEKIWGETIKKAVEDKFKENGRSPDKTNDGKGGGTGEKSLTDSISAHYKN